MTNPGLATTARRALVSDLRAALTEPILATMPPSLYPPCVLVTEESPFITRDETLHGAEAHFRLIALTSYSSDSARTLAALDQMVDEIIEALWSDYSLTVSDYQRFTFANQQTYLGAAIEVTASGYTITAN